MFNSDLFSYLFDQLPTLGEELAEQIFLVSVAMFIAIILGVPLGIFITRFEKFQSPTLAFTSILQTIPSLALLALLLPIFGIGMKPAIIALVLYALLPIVRNTLTGLKNIQENLIQAAQGLGFTRWQQLRIVEIPLALPVIIAGIRTATSMTVGIATISAFIGAGGLGDFITRGLAMSNTRLLLLGAIPAAALALLLDFILARIEHHISPKTYSSASPKKSYFFVTLLTITLLVFVIFTFIFITPTHRVNTIRIATKNFTEQFILGEMLAQLITDKTHLQVVKKFDLGTTEICQQAMIHNEIDMYPEYTGTAYITILQQSENSTPDKIYAYVKNAYAKQFHLIWLQPFGFDNSQSLAVRQDFADQYHLNTISDLTTISNKLILGAPAEFIDRPDGVSGLQRVYQLQFGQIKNMDPNLMYQAINNKQVNIICAFTTDGRIPAYHLKILTDNKHLFPPYFAAPIIREAMLTSHPELKSIIELLANQLDDKAMQELNYEVDVEKKTPADVAHQFLLEKHLL